MAKKAARIDRRISVILLEFDKHLGEKYEMVKVKAIFAKNVLLPKKIAVVATPDTINAYKAKMAAALKTKEKKASDLGSLFDKINNDNGLMFSMKANEKGVLYEKIDVNHIVNRIKELYDIAVSDHLFKMKKKIIALGEYTIGFSYNTVEKDLRVVVKADHSKKDAETVETKEEAKEEAVA